MISRATGTLLLVLAIASPAMAQGRIPPDAINLNGVFVYNSPQDVASWPVTTAITQLTMRPNSDPYYRGISLNFSARATWPDYTPPGWDGPLQYTVWVVWYAAGQWNASGVIQMWRDRASTGAPLLEFDPGCSVNNFACNWVYDARWGPGHGHQAFAGETMYFFVTPGDARGPKTVTSLRERSNVVAVTLPAGDIGSFTFPATIPVHPTALDVDGDGKSEISLYRPSTGQWLALFSTTNFNNWGSLTWGQPGDVPVPGDYDGDGRVDLAVYRPSTGQWLISLSSTRFASYVVYQWGNSSDTPVPADYDGDGRTDLAVYRPSNGNWIIAKSTGGYGSWVVYQWGIAGDKPVPNDYDGDGKADLAVYRPSSGSWIISRSATSFSANWVFQWGASGDVPMPGDYDGDGKCDLVVYRPSTGAWLIARSSANYGWVAYSWGISGDIPVRGDFDGDGKADLAVYRPSTGQWLIVRSSTNNASWFVATWGNPGDIPLVQTQ